MIEWYRYCNGEHDCYYGIVSSPAKLELWKMRKYIPESLWRTLQTGDVKIFQELDNGNVNARKYRMFLQDSTALSAMATLLADHVLEANGNTPYAYSSLQPLAFYESDKSNWNADNKFKGYDGRGNIVYDESLPEVVPGGSLRCANSTHKFTLDYKQCDFDDNYRALQEIVDSEMRVNEGLVVPPLSRMAYYTSKDHMLSDGIAAWSRNRREAEDRFVSNLLNASLQCRNANKQESICSVRADGRAVYVLNPWLGGNFNVLEASSDGTDGGCDSNQLDLVDQTFFAQTFSLDSSCSSEKVCTGSNLALWNANIPQVLLSFSFFLDFS